MGRENVSRQGSLRFFREMSGLTISIAAVMLSISVNELERFEANSGDAPCGLIVKICRLYGIPSADHIT